MFKPQNRASNGLIQSRLAIFADQHRCSRELCHVSCGKVQKITTMVYKYPSSTIIHRPPPLSISLNLQNSCKLLRLPVAQWTTIPLGLCCRKSQAGPRWSISKLKIHKNSHHLQVVVSLNGNALWTCVYHLQTRWFLPQPLLFVSPRISKPYGSDRHAHFRYLLIIKSHQFLGCFASAQPPLFRVRDIIPSSPIIPDHPRSSPSSRRRRCCAVAEPHTVEAQLIRAAKFVKFGRGLIGLMTSGGLVTSWRRCEWHRFHGWWDSMGR